MKCTYCNKDINDSMPVCKTTKRCLDCISDLLNKVSSVLTEEERLVPVENLDYDDISKRIIKEI